MFVLWKSLFTNTWLNYIEFDDFDSETDFDNCDSETDFDTKSDFH